MADIWVERELELTRKHEELLLRREALLEGTEAYYHTQDRRAASFITDISKAQERNQRLLQSMSGLLDKVNRQHSEISPRFHTLRKNYWSMVRSVFPVWYEQYCRETDVAGGQTNLAGGQAGRPTPGTQSGRTTWQPSLPLVRQPSPPPYQAPVTRVTTRSLDADEATDVEIPPLDLDFSMGEDSVNPTPKYSTPVPSTSGTHTSDKHKRVHYDQKKEKRVHYDEAQLQASKMSSKTSTSKHKGTDV